MCEVYLAAAITTVSLTCDIRDRNLPCKAAAYQLVPKLVAPDLAAHTRTRNCAPISSPISHSLLTIVIPLEWGNLGQCTRVDYIAIS